MHHTDRTGQYRQLAERYEQEFEQLSSTHRRLGIIRLLVMLGALACFYAAYSSGYHLWTGTGIVGIAIFLWLVKWQQRVEKRRLLVQELLHINRNELSFLTNDALPFADGSPYTDPAHPYAADLDLFGHRSLYQHLNRTATPMGQDSLAASLLTPGSTEEILQRQAIITEVAERLDARQHFQATARLSPDARAEVLRLQAWAVAPLAPIRSWLRVVSFAMPSVLAVCILMYIFTHDPEWWSAITTIVPLQLAIFSIAFKRIKDAIAGTEKVQKLLLSYAALLRLIEDTDSDTPWFKSLQRRLQHNGATASRHIHTLAGIYNSMEQVHNPFALVGMNGLYLHHIHILHQLVMWKQQNAACISTWLQCIGETEAIYSLAGFRYNNAGYCFPTLNDNAVIQFTELGHPVIPAAKRVCNDISFAQNRFVVLTGSNMSGKSTFLRTLGVNMALAGAGAPVCATAATLQPMDMFVSMRQSDSLADNESYFFAEVKRLHQIIERLNAGPAFVLLDEILRGTNSDDKRSGTVGVIEKIVGTQAIGAIATHDLEVCLTTDRYPQVLVNKCFEVEIHDNELVFDYKLRNGVCRNKSATFIMKKMRIID